MLIKDFTLDVARLKLFVWLIRLEICQKIGPLRFLSIRSLPINLVLVHTVIVFLLSQIGGALWGLDRKSPDWIPYGFLWPISRIDGLVYWIFTINWPWDMTVNWYVFIILVLILGGFQWWVIGRLVEAVMAKAMRKK